MRFSIIVPVYNVETFLVKCLESIKNQTFADFECILIDDGSKDNSGTICDEYALKDDRFKVIHKQNGGQTSARIAGLNTSRGEYIICLDGDDFADVTLCETCSNAINKHDSPDIIHYDFYHYFDDENMQVEGGLIPAEHYLKDEFSQYYKYLICDTNGQYFSYSLWRMAVKRDLFAKYQLPIDTRIIMGEDFCVSVPCFAFAESVCVLGKPLYYYRHNRTGITFNRKKGYAWQDLDLRIDYLKGLLLNHSFDFDAQINRYYVIGLYAIALSHLRTDRPYKEIKKEIKAELKKPHRKDYIKNCKFKSLKCKLELFAIKHKNVWLLKKASQLKVK